MFQRAYRMLRKRVERIGAWRERRVRAVLTAIFVAWIILDGHVLHISGGIAHSTYDWMVRHRIHVSPTDPRIVIVDIDEASLAKMSGEFGRWPWPRDTLATVLADIERQQPAAIVWDILFSDPDRLSPGGDSAFDQAVQASKHSHFAVVRLPATNDGESQITADVLPGLWASKGAESHVTVALIPPFLNSIARAPLGLSNAYPDSDGVIRRFRPVERLQDGSLLQSLPVSVLRTVDEARWQRTIARAIAPSGNGDELVIWRGIAGRYPRIPFYRVFDVAESGGKLPAFDFRDKLVIIGASAPTLHDFHPTALSDRQNGVDMLATLLDNALNERRLQEIPAGVQSGIAIVLCALIGMRMRLHHLSMINRAIVGVPLFLLAVTYLSLQTEQFYLDLHLAAGWTAGFLALLRLWAGIRMAYWQNMSDVTAGAGLSLLAMCSAEEWADQTKGALVEQVEQCASACRVFFMANSNPPDTWPDAAKLAAVVGPAPQISILSKAVAAHIVNLQTTVVSLPASDASTHRLSHALVAWQNLIDHPADHRQIEK